jgi:protein-S-isoprenylcysteine O-methyltransferase Ste14
VVFILICIFLKLKGIDQSTRQLHLHEKFQKLDIPGVVLIVASVSCLFLALQQGGTVVPWSHSRPIGLFIGFGLIFLAFGAWQWKAGEDATVPLRYLKNRTVIWGSMYLFWDNMALYIVGGSSDYLKPCSLTINHILHAILFSSSFATVPSGKWSQLHVIGRAPDGRPFGRRRHNNRNGTLCQLSCQNKVWYSLF